MKLVLDGLEVIFEILDCGSMGIGEEGHSVRVIAFLLRGLGCGGEVGVPVVLVYVAVGWMLDGGRIESRMELRSSFKEGRILE